MDNASKIKQALIETLGLNPYLAITATVVAVDGDTCTVKLVSELEIPDVRLNATVNDGADTLIMHPKVGSEVICISQTGSLDSLIVIKIDAVEKIKFKRGAFEFEIDGTTGKLTLKKDVANFGSLIGNLIDAVKSAVIDTPNGPGSINASTQTTLNTIKTQFNTILNSN